MTILLLARSLDHGGAERQLTVLARGLHERGHRVDVAVFYPGGSLESELQAEGIPVHSLEKRGRWDLLGFLGRTRRLIRRLRPQLLHGYLIAPNLVATAMRVVFPEVKLVWGVRASDMDLQRYDLLSRVTFRAGCWFSRTPDRILVNSRSGLDYHRRQGYPAERMGFVPNGIDTDRFRPRPDRRQETRRTWGIDPRFPLIGMAARLDPMKDHRTFIAAARLLVARRPDVRFVWVGDGPQEYRARLFAEADDLIADGRLHWAGRSNDMPDVYNAFDLATSTSSFGEGFSNAVGEAMACGTPCVVTDVGDSATIVGETGRVVAVGDPGSLAGAWEVGLEGSLVPASEIRRRIVENYSVRALIERTERELERVIRQGA